MHTYETTWDTETLPNINLRIEYDWIDETLFIGSVSFLFDTDMWIEVPGKWRKENLEYFRSELKEDALNLEAEADGSYDARR